MAHAEEIDKAIAAHSNWKAELRQAVKTGYIHTPVETIRMADQCYFGKWLEGPALSAAEKKSPDYEKVKAHHAEFHQTAGLVAELVKAGRSSEAEELMSLGGEYSKISAKLTRAMLDWKNSPG